jgi:hypothetical protein
MTQPFFSDEGFNTNDGDVSAFNLNVGNAQGRLQFSNYGSKMSESVPGTGQDFQNNPTVTVTGGGSGLLASVSFGYGGEAYYNVNNNSGGIGYAIGDTFKILGTTFFGGTSPANDVLMQVDSLYPLTTTALDISLVSGTPPTFPEGAYVTNNDTNFWVFNMNGTFQTPGNITTNQNVSAANVIVNSNVVLLNGATIQSGTTTVVNDTINSISLSTIATIDVNGFPFDSPSRGLVTISGTNIGTGEALGTWHYQAINNNAFVLYTDDTYSTPVDSSAWTPYTGGGGVAITINLPVSDIVINSNGYESTFTLDGQLNLPGTVVTTPVPAANLPSPVAGGRAFVNDSNLPAAGNFAETVVGGAGNTVPVWSDGTNWYIG